MENNQFPEQEEQNPSSAAEKEAIPLPFSAGTSLTDAEGDAATPIAAPTEAAAAPENADAPAVPAEAPDAAAPESGNDSTDAEKDFMSHIPDTDADYPEMVTPEIGEEITPDENAMRFHGMRNHGKEEPPFDMSILDDPALSEEPSDAEQDDDSADQEYRDNSQDFEEMMNAKEEENASSSHAHPIRKGRPKRRRSEWLLGIPNILSTVVWLALIVVIGVTAGRMLWVCAADVLAFGRENKEVTVTVYESDSMDDIIGKLYDAGLIRYKGLFGLYASISNAEEKIQPGIYDLNTLYDYHALVNFMSPRSSREVIELTIPEGYTCRQIFSLLEENRVCTAVDIGAYAASGELEDYWFLENVTRGDEYCLEGFLFPDTYQFYKNSTPKEALERMLDNFDVRFSEEMRAQIDTLNANVTGGGYTVREVTIVASLIEKESAAPAESPTIAGVIYNRLFRWGDNPAYLNIDASIIYALDGKTDLTQEDLQVDSPYNTYTHTGLTPTPISNPGLASLQAALNPESHDYYYYVLNPSTGMHQFSSTYEEHSAYVSQFSEG